MFFDCVIIILYFVPVVLDCQSMYAFFVLELLDFEFAGMGGGFPGAGSGASSQGAGGPTIEEVD